MSQNFDLLGDPIPDDWYAQRKRGRPEHKPTKEKRNKVMMLQAFGWSDVQICQALSITKPTLKKHYFRELKFREEAQRRVEANMLMTLGKLASAGNVAAVKEFNRLFEKSVLDQRTAQFKAGQDDVVDPTAGLGKKEAANLKAETAHEGTSWNELIPRPDLLQ